MAAARAAPKHVITATGQICQEKMLECPSLGQDLHLAGKTESLGNSFLPLCTV